ncbi:MAG: glycosyltransferase family 2 protein [Patescibacteria group bacterium]
MQKVSVVILNYNGKDNTLDCLSSLQNVVTIDTKLEIIVVDNASKDESVAFIKSQISNLKSQKLQLKVIENRENLGFAGGNNVGIRYALEHGADYVLVLNNDTLVDKNLIDELLKVGNSDENIGILAPKIYFAKGFEFHKNRYTEKDLGKVFWYAGGKMDWKNVIASHKGVDEVDHGQYDKTEETSFASGCCMFMKKEVFGRVGLFDKKYFLYYEDADLSERLKEAGYKIIYNPSAIIWHKNAGSAGGSGSKLQDYYITRNRLLFGMRYAPLRSKLALIKESMKVLISGRYWQKRGILDFYLNKFGKGSYKV